MTEKNSGISIINQTQKPHFSIFLPSLRGGGAERMMVNLVQGITERGYPVDLVLVRAEGPYLSEVPPDARIIDLKSRRVLTSLPGLIKYLRKERPTALLSAMDHANIIAIWAARWSRIPIRVLASVRNTLSVSSQHTTSLRNRLIPFGIRIFYIYADLVIAVSWGVAEDLVRLTRLSREKIRVIYNPVITPDIFEKAKEKVNHPWLTQKECPVILGVGRLTEQKDFSTLIRAFSIIHKQVLCRLIILGEGKHRLHLESLVEELGLNSCVDLPGFVKNPFSYMARSNVCVLSSLWEGLPGALIQAMACGCPVVSTNCPSGPEEILEDGKWGRLVPVRDAAALARAITDTMNDPNPPDVVQRAQDFGLDTAVESYLKVLLGGRKK